MIVAYFASSRDETIVIYQCANCNKFFTSYIGQEFHNCYKGKVCNVSQEAYDCYFDFVCCCNISERAATGKYFERLMTVINADFVTPKEHQFKKMLIDYAIRIQSHMIESLRGEAVSILMDAARKCCTEFEGIILYTRKSLNFFSLTAIKDEKSLTLAALISEVVKYLENNEIHVVSVCSDNASNNKKALNAQEGSAQSLSGVFFIRQGCGAHSINLAIKDVFDSNTFNPLLNAMKTICKFYKGPQITIRWSSIYEVAKFICNNYDRIKNEINFQPRPKAGSRNAREYDLKKCAINMITMRLLPMKLPEFLSVIREVERLIQCLEEDQASIVDLFTRIFRTIAELKLLPQYPFTAMIIKAIENRAITTLDMHIPLLAFLLTREGLIVYRNSSSESREDVSKMSLLNNALYGMASYINEKGVFLNLSTSRMDEIFTQYKQYFIQYLNNADPETISYQFWNEKTKCNDSDDVHFSTFCRDILTIPASESAVERLFAHLQRVYNHSNIRMHYDTINYRMCIKMYNIFKDVSKPAKSIPYKNFKTMMNCFNAYMLKEK